MDLYFPSTLRIIAAICTSQRRLSKFLWLYLRITVPLVEVLGALQSLALVFVACFTMVFEVLVVVVGMWIFWWDGGYVVDGEKGDGGIGGDVLWVRCAVVVVILETVVLEAMMLMVVGVWLLRWWICTTG